MSGLAGEGRDRGTGWMALVLLIVGAAVYANSLAGPFVWDDLNAIERNPNIRQFWPPGPLLMGPPNSPVTARPVPHVSLALNHAVGELNPFGYHLVNLALHLGCGLLLFGCVRRTLGRGALASSFGSSAGFIALAASLLWMVHPLLTEAVVYVTQRTELFMALFFLLTLYASIRALDAKGWRWPAVAVVACALGMASKEVMVVAPVAILLYDRIYAFDGWREAWRRRWRLYTWLAATWAILVILQADAPHAEIGFSLGLSPWEWALTQTEIILQYLARAVWPHPLVFDYGRAAPVPFGDVIVPGITLLALLLATVVALIVRPRAGYLAAWFFIVLGPTSSFVPIITEVGAERRVYLAIAGPIVLAVVGAELLRRRLVGADAAREWVSKAAIGLLVLVVLALGVTTMRRNADYGDAVRLWRTAVDARPDNQRTHLNLGSELERAGRVDEALASYRRTLELEPDNIVGLEHLGRSLAATGDLVASAQTMRRVTELRPEYAEGRYNLGVVLRAAKRHPEARDALMSAIVVDPDHVKARIMLGQTLSDLGEPVDAVAQFDAALKRQPAAAAAWFNRGMALCMSGRPADGLRSLEEAVRLQPNYPDALNNAAWLRATSPDETLRDPERALAMAAHAVRITGGRRPAMLDTLAAAHAAAGQYDDAVRVAEQAIAALAGTPLADEISGRLVRYRAGQPFVDGAGP